MKAAKEIVLEFYKSDALIDTAVMQEYLHDDVKVEWHSSKGFITMNHKDVMALTLELGKAYVHSNVRIKHILAEGDTVSVSYAHYIKTVENPREEMLLAYFMIVWELKDGLLHRGFQMSQLN